MIGRHDPVLPPREVPVVEAMLALALVDLILLAGRINPAAWMVTQASTGRITTRAVPTTISRTYFV